MRLIKAEIQGFGRIATGTINLDNKVIAVVGPNEAGKTTLLRALAFIDNGVTLSGPERSRGMAVPDDETVVKVQYLLDRADQTHVEDWDLEEPPTELWLSRKAASATEILKRVHPVPRKSVAPLNESVARLRAVATQNTFDQLNPVLLEPDLEDTEPVVDEDRLLLRAQTEKAVIDFLADAGLDGALAATSRHADALRSTRDGLVALDLADGLRDELDAILSWFDREEPSAAVAEALWERSPTILLFDENDRTLGSNHTLSAELVESPPAALRNLVKMADLDLAALWAAIATGDEGERETLIDEANRTLAAKFAAAWKQSQITVVLKTERTDLSIRIKQDGKRITQFDERSAGLKMFVALVAFLYEREQTSPPILLIDEAETHLHIDAQADLVNTFMTQQQAAKIIYTTHSPACLPPDLGSNIRAVVPDPKHEYRSLIKGSFWNGDAGFSPLMLAMGAGAAAFSTARYVVLGEGASEMLALPTLIKRTIDVSDLKYQVAPGLSEVPREMYPELDLAGARVAYLVDGDQGGQDLRNALIKGGVPEESIVTLGALTLENLVDQDAYREGVGLLLSECNPGRVIPDLPALPAPTEAVWPPIFDLWAKENDLKMPGKRVVASRLVEEGLAVPSEFGKPILKQLHFDIGGALGINA